MKKRYICFLLMLFPLLVISQTVNYEIRGFVSDDYHAHVQNWDIIQGGDERIYVANGEALLIYDGTNWIRKPIVSTIPIRSLAIHKNTIYVGTKGDFGYLAKTENSDYVFKSLMSKISKDAQDFGDVWNVHVQHDTIYYQTFRGIYCYINDTVRLIPTKGRCFPAFQFANGYYVKEANMPVQQLRDYKLFPLKNTQFFKLMTVKQIFPIDNDNLLVFTSQNGIFKVCLSEMDSAKCVTQLCKDLNEFWGKNRIYSVKKMQNGNFAVGTLNSGVVMLDKNLKIVEIIDKDKGLTDNRVWQLFIDKNQNIWVATDNGISFINFQTPLLKLKVDGKPLPAVNDLLVVNYSSNRLVYACTMRGFYEFNMEHENKINEVSKISNDELPVWNIVRLDSTNYLVGGMNDLFLFNSKNKKLESLLKTRNVLKIHYITKNTSLLLSEDGFYKVVINKDKATFKHVITKLKGDYVSGRTFDIDSLNNLWLYTNQKKFCKYQYYVEKDSLAFLQLISDSVIPNVAEYRIYSHHSQLFLYNENTIYTYDYQRSVFNKQKINLNISYLNCFEMNNNLAFWVVDSLSDNYIATYNSEISIDYKTRLLNLLKNFQSWSRDCNDNKFYVGGSKGLNIIDLSRTDLLHRKFNVHISNLELINVHNSTKRRFEGALSGADSIYPTLSLKYSENAIKIDFSAQLYEYPEFTEYSYYLEGFDDDWSPWTKKTSKEYTYLHEGKYVFHVKAKDGYGNVCESKSFYINVLPPWYRTIFAYILYVIILLLCVYFILKYYTRKLRNDKIKLEQIVRERTEEIWQQKEEIQSQADYLKELNKELETLSIVASQTDNSIVICDVDGYLEWANLGFNKLYGYSIKEYREQFGENLFDVCANSEKARIKESVLIEKKTISYESEFTPKTGNKIWLQTTLTPILVEERELFKIVSIESDITKLKESEKEILEKSLEISNQNAEILAQRDELADKNELIEMQNESIRGSIRCASDIQNLILPEQVFINQYFNHFILYQPKDIVSGDFYWFSVLELNQTKHYFAAAVDCTGHGVPGAFMSVISHMLMNQIIHQNKIISPDQILESLHNSLFRMLKQDISNNHDGMDICLCRFEKLDSDSYTVSYSGSKNDLIYYNADNMLVSKVKAGKRRIGGITYRRQIDFIKDEIVLRKNSILYLTTDGYIDQNDGARRRLGSTKLMDILNVNCSSPLETQLSKLKKQLNDWQGEEYQRDDITIFALQL